MPRSRKQQPGWPPKRVDFTFVSQLRTSLVREYQAEFAEMRRVESAYDGSINLGIKVPAGAPHHIPSTAMSKVDMASANIISDFPRVEVRAPAPGAKGLKRQERLKALGTYAFERTTATSEEDVWAAAKFDLVMLGQACIKFVFKEDEWPEPPDSSDTEELKDWQRERQTAWPFETYTVHPGQVLVPPDRQWPHKFAIEIQSRSLLDMWTRYPGWRDPLKGSSEALEPTRVVEWVEYWDEQNYIAWAAGVEVFRRHNVHGVVPFIHIGVTRGRKRRPYNVTSGGLGGGMLGGGPKGILGGAVMSQIEAEARLLTILDLLWQYHVFPRLLTNKDEVKAIEDVWNTGPGGVLPVENVDGPDKSVAWLDMPQLNAAMFQLIPLIQTSIRAATFEPALTGERPTGVDYGVHQAILVGQARQALRPFVSALNRMGSAWCNMVFRYVEGILNEDLVVLGEEKVGPSDINGFYQARVTFEATDEATDDRRIELGLRVLAANAEPHLDILRKYFKSEEPYDELIRLQAEQVVKQMIASGAVAQSAMQKANMTLSEEELKAKTDAAVKGHFGRQGRSPAAGELGNRLAPGQGGSLGTQRGEQSFQAGNAPGVAA